MAFTPMLAKAVAQPDINLQSILDQYSRPKRGLWDYVKSVSIPILDLIDNLNRLGYGTTTTLYDLFGGEPNIDGQIVDWCRLDFSVGDMEPSSLHPDWVQVVLDPIEPVVGVTEEASGDEWILQGLRLHPWTLHFVRSEDLDPSTGERIWRIARREEERHEGGTISWDEFLEEV